VWKKKENGKVVPTVETIIEKGVINSQEDRNEANIKYFVLTAEALPAYPWAFDKRKLCKTLI
jgi:hypothetical protein